MRKSLLLATVLGALSVETAQVSADSAGECHAVTVDFVPAKDLQIVAWIEKADGTYVDTAFITQATGTFGLGNRPGRFDFNSGPKWPYGRRITTFPVWAHKHGVSFPEVHFQNDDDSGLSHPFADSSQEAHFCRPLLDTEPSWDTGSCASQIFTDKGVLATNKSSSYPPRSDVKRKVGTDSSDVDKYLTMNPFDAVSQATPAGDVPASFVWSTPASVADGDYVLVVEVSKEFDFNDAYSTSRFPSPSLSAYGDYGEAYRGQPSVVYKVPITIGASDTQGSTDAYVGYGDPDGAIGDIHPADPTISTAVPGSGASRLALTMDGSLMYRVRAKSHVSFDSVAPAAVADVQFDSAMQGTTTATFVAPGDDGAGGGAVSSYDIRLSPVVAITDANFDTFPRVPPPANLAAAGQEQSLELTNLLPDTDYYLAVRPVDDCHNSGATTISKFHTPAFSGEVDACFIATAAYGSLMAADVSMLRHFRDAALKKSVLGELFVETYYTFGPPVAGVVGESELLRATARGALEPIVERVKKFVF